MPEAISLLLMFLGLHFLLFMGLGAFAASELDKVFSG
jgi:hypothetical protein